MKGQERKQNVMPDRSEHVEEQKGADHHRASEVEVPVWPQVTERGSVTPLLYPVAPTPSTR